MLKITISDRIGNIKIVKVGIDSLVLNWDKTYGFEDILTIELEANSFVEVDINQHLKPSIIYTPSGTITYQIPVGYKTKAYHPDAFKLNRQVIRIKKVDTKLLDSRRNLALNALDKRWSTGYYPHAEANVVTRDEPWFEGKNAIDGHIVVDGHGAWPYQSWGGGLRDDLEFTLNFGRDVLIDEVIIYLRADLRDDHDINWESGVIECSNGFQLPIELIMTGKGQSFQFEAQKVNWIKLKELKREVSAAFTALAQIEVFGVDAKFQNDKDSTILL